MADEIVNVNTAAAAAKNPLADLSIESKILPLRAMKVEFVGPDNVVLTGKDFKTRRAMDQAIRLVFPDGRKYMVTDKFWQTFCMHVGLSRNAFDYFNFDEVFNRVSDRKQNNVRLTFENFRQANDTLGSGKLLSVTNPLKPLLHTDEAQALIQKYGGTGVVYNNGKCGASFNCPFPMEFDLFGRHDEKFRSKFYLEMPLDGYGLPASYLQLLRVICTNGVVAMSKAFRTYFSLGANDTTLMPILDRAIEAFNNEEGFHAFKDRLEKAGKSWASLRELMDLTKAITAGAVADAWGLPQRQRILNQLDVASGRPFLLYGITNANEPSPARMRSIPVQITLYDLITFASELDTHQFKSMRAHNCINSWLGNLLTGEYDLENSKEDSPDFNAYFFDNTAALAKANRTAQGL